MPSISPLPAEAPLAVAASAGTSLVADAPAGCATLDHAAVLASWLSLASDAVLVFDAQGTILLANDEAARSFSLTKGPANLAGRDIRSLFPRSAGVDPAAPLPEQLPFALDGTTSLLTRTGSDGRPVALALRGNYISGPHESYLLVAHRDEGIGGASREHERLVEELSRANRRLAGTIDIVLGTLDSPDVGTLFSRVLEELCLTLDATGSAVYLAEPDGFHLQATSASLTSGHIPSFLPQGRPLTQLASMATESLRLRVLPPHGEELRGGTLVYRTVRDELTQASYQVKASQLPPFASFLLVPVRFGGEPIALIEVGWRSARAISDDDAHLLDAVTRYLSVQIVGALGALRTRRQEELSAKAADLRDALVAQPLSPDSARLVAETLEHDLDCRCVTVDLAKAQGGLVALRLPGATDEISLPVNLLTPTEAVTPITPATALGAALAGPDAAISGALLHVEGTGDEPAALCLLVLRLADTPPLGDLELGYLRQVTDTLAALSREERGRRQDHRISQALQQGMRSALQQVDGISAAGIYSSATKAAFVGGDFYDLIALPDQRACVIMGDVSGKGVEAASVSAAVRTALGAYSWEGLEPARMVELLNDFLLGFARIETFATLFVGIVDLPAATLTYCSAGHPPALMLRHASGNLEWLGVQSGLVGAFREMRYQNGKTQLGTGDILLLYTDGTTEARADDGRFFGEEGLRDAVMHERAGGFEGLLDRLLADVDAFTGYNLEDDVAMVALRFDEVG